MRLIIDNGAYTLRNMGDVAMLQVTIARARRLFAGAEFLVVTSKPELLQRYCPGTQPLLAADRNAAYLPAAPVRKRPFKALFRKLRGKKTDSPPDPQAFRAALRSSDGILVSGGGFLNDLNEQASYAVLRMLGDAQAQGKPVALFGQGLGPLVNPRLTNELRDILERGAWISLRETLKGPEIASRAHAKPERVSMTGDDALALCPNAGSRPGERDMIGVSIREIAYSGVEAAHLERLTAALKAVEERTGAELIPVPISFNDFEDDLSAIRRVARIAPGTKVEDTPKAVVEAAGKARLVVTGTYHAAVFALGQGVPCICFYASPYYFDKLRGLQEQFGEGCTLLDLSAGDFVEKVTAECDRLRNASPALEQHLRTAAQQQVRAAEAFYAQVLKTFGNG